MLDIEKFIKDGWCIVDVPSMGIVQSPLFDLHARGLSDEEIKFLHIKLSEEMWESEMSLLLASHMHFYIQQLIGLDIMVQYFPYFRIARPNKPQDNIGYHKDTQYGQTPYELAVHIPFVDLDEKSAIRVITGSHLMPENLFIGVTPDGKSIEKGSIDNQMGKPYMPKCLKVPEGMETTPLYMKVGQAAIFSPSIFHGQEVNEGSVTRVSCDLRFVSSRAPFDIRKGKVHAGYVQVAQSPVEMMAEQYYNAQKEML